MVTKLGALFIQISACVNRAITQHVVTPIPPKRDDGEAPSGPTYLTYRLGRDRLMLAEDHYLTI